MQGPSAWVEEKKKDCGLHHDVLLSVDSLTRTHAPERVVGVSILYGGPPCVSVLASGVGPRMNGPQQEPPSEVPSEQQLCPRPY